MRKGTAGNRQAPVMAAGEQAQDPQERVTSVHPGQLCVVEGVKQMCLFSKVQAEVVSHRTHELCSERTKRLFSNIWNTCCHGCHGNTLAQTKIPSVYGSGLYHAGDAHTSSLQSLCLLLLLLLLRLCSFCVVNRTGSNRPSGSHFDLRGCGKERSPSAQMG